jgi:HD superfamily phosphodiesterase
MLRQLRHDPWATARLIEHCLDVWAYAREIGGFRPFA